MVNLKYIKRFQLVAKLLRRDWRLSGLTEKKNILNILEEEQTELPITRSYLIFVTFGTLPHYFSL